MSTALCLAPHVATLAQQALKTSHTLPSIFKVENLTPSSWQVELKQLSGNLHARNLHARNPHGRNSPFNNVPKCDRQVHNLCTYVHPKNRSLIQSHALMHSAKCALQQFSVITVVCMFIQENKPTTGRASGTTSRIWGYHYKYWWITWRAGNPSWDLSSKTAHVSIVSGML